MIDPRQDLWENRVRAFGQRLVYPSTPDLWPVTEARLARIRTGSFVVRRLAPAVAFLLVLIATGIAAVPSARAAFLRALRIGVIRVLVEPTPAATSPVAATLSPTAHAVSLETVVGELAGETDLEQLRRSLGDLVRLPGYPPDLGEPDLVYQQGEGRSLGLLIWLEPGHPDRVRLALHILGPEAFAAKSEARLIEETEVGGSRALWMVGPHLLLLRDGRYELRTLVEGNVLAWVVGDATYRLESTLPLDEARRVAESLR